MKINKISTKIKLLGALVFLLMAVIIGTTIHLNSKNKKDALIINIAGKERMLTQRISKNIFYLYHNNYKNFKELDAAINEFVYNLNSLKNGNKALDIEKAPTDEIFKQILKVEQMWANFSSNVSNFKDLLLIEDEYSEKLIKTIVKSIYNTNNQLLNEVDNLVTMYTLNAELKSEEVKNFQYISAFIVLLLIIYSFTQLKAIEENANKFLDFSKKMSEDSNNNVRIEPLEIKAENEIEEAANTINCFINKVNKAMDYSESAIEQSKNASYKLEEITDEFDKVLSDLSNSTEISKTLNKSEDIVIETTENLISSTKKLQELKNELDKLILTCSDKK